MNTYTNMPETDIVRTLLRKYFDASISPMEMDRLEQLARDAAAGKARYDDPGVEDELRLISSISQYAEFSLTDFAENLPDGLEGKLNAHISMLAAKSGGKRRRPRALRFLSYSAAAALTGIIAAGAYIFLSPDNLPSGKDILIAGVSRVEEADTQATPLSSPASQQAIPAIAAISSDPAKSPLNRTKTISERNTQSNAAHTPSPLPGPDANADGGDTVNTKTFVDEAGQAISMIPPFAKDVITVSEEAFQVMPSGIEAYVETSKLLVQPMSTLSQSINCIYESVEIVSEALSGVSTAMQAVNSSLALLSTPI